LAHYSELAGRVALVTGARRGIGLSIARSLSAQGCAVAMCDVAPAEEMSEVRAQVSAGGGETCVYTCDVRDTASVAQTVESIESRFGTIHLLINNAGITADSVMWKMSDEQWCNVIATNLGGSFKLMRAVSPLMRAQKWGRIVNIASINALRGKFGQSNYAASKAGVIGLTLSAARELAREQITVNAIAPGFIETEMTSGLPGSVLDVARGEVLLGRLGTPKDIANAVAFLCSDSASHITGTVMRVDGGQCL
jgi:3-oxoacyl-[acyl-carrier protein] reductase